MATSVRASSQNSATSGTAASVVAPVGTTAGDVVVIAAHFNGQTTIVDNNTNLSIANLTAGSDSTDDADSTTDSITVTAGKLQLLTIASRADAVQPTIASITAPVGSGIVWTLVGTAVDYDASGSRRTLFLYRGMATATVSGTFVITWGGTQTAKVWNVDEVTGADTSGTQGSGAIVQSNTNTGSAGTSLSIALGGFSDAANATYGAFSNAGSGTFVAGSGFTITNQIVGGTAEIAIGCEFKTTNDTGVDITFPTDDSGGIAIEIKSAKATFTEDINDYKPNTTSGHTVSIFSRRIVSGDPLVYNFTGGASGRWSIIAVTFQNPHATDIYDVAPSTTNADNLDSPAGSGDATAPTITTLTDNAIHCALAFIDASADDFDVWPAGYTVQQSVDNNQGQTFATKVITPAGATGVQTFEHNGTGTAFIGLSFAVKDVDGDAASAPTVTTSAATSVTGNSAVGNGNVTSDGGATVTERGFAYGTSANPTTAGNKVVVAGTTGAYTGDITGLSANTTYHYRAYATNSEGTSYGADTEFTTSAATVPTVSNGVASQITKNSVVVAGNVTSAGGSVIVERGFVLSTSPTPTINDTKFLVGGGTGSFSLQITKLKARKTYYVRAFARNSYGVSYG